MTDTPTMGLVYDASAVSRILGIPVECSDPVPEAADGEIVIYYGGWDLPALRDSPAGKKRMWQEQNWYEEYGWKAELGYYRVLLPVPKSNRQNWNEQLLHLATIDTAWQPSPVCIAATALLVHLTETGNDLLSGDWCRCAEALSHFYRYRAELTVRGGLVFVGDGWIDGRSDFAWLSVARKS